MGMFAGVLFCCVLYKFALVKTDAHMGLVMNKNLKLETTIKKNKIGYSQLENNFVLGASLGMTGRRVTGR